MTFRPGHGNAALRIGRFSLAQASYFLTLCTRKRMTGLACDAVFRGLQAVTDRMTDEGSWQIRVMTVMPDHLHLVARLGDRVALSEAVRLFKGRTTPLLRAVGLGWQPGVFDHRLRPEEPVLPVFHYIFMNPYRARLLPLDQAWPYFACSAEDRVWYKPGLDGDIPDPVWLPEMAG